MHIFRTSHLDPCAEEAEWLTLSNTSRYADHVGIHYVLCSKLRQFSYEEIEFFLPQLCHLIISVDNESMALEEFILDLCEESVNAALLVRHFRGSIIHDTNSDPLDILALPVLLARSFLESAVETFPDLSADI